MSYSVWLLAHLLGVVLFLGTFLVSFVSKAMAERAGTPAAIAQAFAAIQFSDRWLMPPAVTTMIVSGIALAGRVGLPLARTGWVLWPALLLGLSGILFLVRVGPLQRRIEQTARAAPADPFDWTAYRRAARAWLLWASLAFAVNLAAMAVMVLKPALPGF